MTVKELIKELEKYDEDSNVIASVSTSSVMSVDINVVKFSSGSKELQIPDRVLLACM